MIDPKDLPARRRVYRCKMCHGMHDAQHRPPEHVSMLNQDQDETTLQVICPDCARILDEQPEVDAARQILREARESGAAG